MNRKFRRKRTLAEAGRIALGVERAIRVLQERYQARDQLGPRAWLYRVEFDDAGNGRIVARINDPIRRLAQSRLVPVIWRVPLDALA